MEYGGGVELEKPYQILRKGIFFSHFNPVNKSPTQKIEYGNQSALYCILLLDISVALTNFYVDVFRFQDEVLKLNQVHFIYYIFTIIKIQRKSFADKNLLRQGGKLPCACILCSVYSGGCRLIFLSLKIAKFLSLEIIFVTHPPQLFQPLFCKKWCM